MQQYDFRTWQQDGADTPALVKLKEWISKELHAGFIAIVSDGKMIIDGGGQEFDFFEPTLLPYFFDEQGIVGWIRPYDDDWGIDVIQDTQRGVFRRTRLETDHALWNRCKDLLNTKLSSVSFILNDT